MIDLHADGCLCDLSSATHGQCTCSDPLDLPLEDLELISNAKLTANATQLPGDRARVDQLVTAALARKNSARRSKKDDAVMDIKEAWKVLGTIGIGRDHTINGVRLDSKSETYVVAYAETKKALESYATAPADHSDEIDESTGEYRYDHADSNEPTAQQIHNRRMAVRNQAGINVRNRIDSGRNPTEAELEAETMRLLGKSGEFAAPSTEIYKRSESAAARHNDEAARSAALRPTGYVEPKHDPRVHPRSRKVSK